MANTNIMTRYTYIPVIGLFSISSKEFVYVLIEIFSAHATSGGLLHGVLAVKIATLTCYSFSFGKQNTGKNHNNNGQCNKT